HQHHIGSLAGDQLDGLGAVGGLTDHLDVVLDGEHHRETGPDQCLVVHQCHTDGHAKVLSSVGSVSCCCGTGNRTRTRQPGWCSRGPISTMPWCRSARSVIPRRPYPVPAVPGRGRPASSTSTSSHCVSGLVPVRRVTCARVAVEW